MKKQRIGRPTLIYTAISGTFVMLMLALSPLSMAQPVGLPKSVQSDLLQADILDDLKTNRFRAALRRIDEQRKQDPMVPPTVLFLEAKVADKIGDSLRTIDALRAYFKVVGRDDKDYDEALRLVRRNQAKAASARALQETQAKLDRIVPGLGMVEIRGGSYLMGEAAGNGETDGLPNHPVTVESFLMGANEVTFDQFDIFASATGRPLPEDRGWGRGNRPVINVSWDDAKAFIAWLNDQSGLKFRLPNEAEWEYAARAGTTTDYYWGATASHEYANYGENVCCVGFAQGRDQWINTSPVGSFPPNPWGLYDMLGNVWEWTEDCGNDSYEGAPVDGSVWASGDCSRRIVHGGSWFDNPPDLRVSGRYAFDTSSRLYSLGFRLAEDSSSLPKSVQSELLQADILDDMKANRFQAALEKIDERRKLDTTVLPVVLFLEAKAADKTGDSSRVVDTLAAYFNLIGRNDKDYAEALNLVRRNQAKAASVRAAKMAESQAKLDRIVPGLDMVEIPGGLFQMGTAGNAIEKPVHTVTLKPFRMSAYDVTFDQFDIFVSATGRPLPEDRGWGRGNRPVINVSWEDAKAFIAWLNEQSGLKFRLPSEAEWEYAARAGTTTDYYWGATASHEYANYGQEMCCEGFAQGRDQWINTSPVGSFPPNPWGLYDLLGNVWQWTEDCWNESYEGAPADGAAWVSGQCSRRMVRGGAWGDHHGDLRASGRYRYGTTVQGGSLGFRLALDN